MHFACFPTKTAPMWKSLGYTISYSFSDTRIIFLFFH